MGRPNAGIEAWYRKSLNKLIDDMHKSTLYWLKARYRMAMDDNPADLIQQQMDKLIKKWERQFDEHAEAIAGRFVDKTLKFADLKISQKLLEKQITVKLTIDKEMRTVLKSAINENVNLIKSIPSQHFTQINTLVMQSVSRGGDLQYLTNQLQERYGVTRRRAAFIARDQNRKAMSFISKERSVSLGLNRATWQHSGAGREPRSSHVAASGKEFDLRKGMKIDGKYILPGEEINCRCTYSVIIDGLTDD